MGAAKGLFVRTAVLLTFCLTREKQLAVSLFQHEVYKSLFAVIRGLIRRPKLTVVDL